MGKSSQRNSGVLKRANIYAQVCPRQDLRGSPRRGLRTRRFTTARRRRFGHKTKRHGAAKIKMIAVTTARRRRLGHKTKRHGVAEMKMKAVPPCVRQPAAPGSTGATPAAARRWAL